ncbi:MAG TPA: transporter substrate-binding domain-containing protein [Acidimicrobiales bacterium]|nr:transporter substrate-binding domain-containing protein [Acidimicrobiales bacterium]
MTSTKASRIAALLFTLILVVSACGKDDNATVSSEGSGSGSGTGSSAEAIDTIATGKLTVCSDIPYAPFEFEEAGNVVGIDPDLMRAVGHDLELDVVFQDTDFDGIFAALAARKCDVIASSVSITDERKKANDFTDGYFEINQSLLVRVGDKSTVDSLEKLSGRVVGVQSETTGAAFANERAKDAGFKVKEFTGADEMFTALKAKQVDGLVQDFPINAYNARVTGDTFVAKVFTDTEKEQYGFVVRKGNDELRKAIDKALDGLRASGGYDKILGKYLTASEG